MSLSNYTGKEIIKALYLLVPDLKGAVVQDTTIETWDATSAQPTDEQIVQACAEVRYDTEVKSYQQQRKLEYPSVNEQLDSIYHGTLTSWKNDIKVIKDKYPKATKDATELQTRKDQALFDLRKEKYDKAVARLAQYQVAVGQTEVKETKVIGTQPVFNESTKQWENQNVTQEQVTTPAIAAVPATVDVIQGDDTTPTTIENPLITKDNQERSDAQAGVYATPQAVKDA